MVYIVIIFNNYNKLTMNFLFYFINPYSYLVNIPKKYILVLYIDYFKNIFNIIIY